MKIPVMITIDTDSRKDAEEMIDRIFRTAANSLAEYEPLTYDAFTEWRFIPRMEPTEK